MHVNVKRTRKRDAQIEKLKCYLLSVVIACGVEFSMSSSSSSEDEGSESDTSQPPVAAVAKRSDTPAPQRTSRKMQSDAQERGAAPAATGHKATAKRSPQSKQQQLAESGRKGQDDKPAPGKDARQRQKKGSAQEATLAEKTRKRERPESPPREVVDVDEGDEGEVLPDLPNVVRRFAKGWLEEKQYRLLQDATTQFVFTVPRDLREQYDSFRKNLLMASDKEGDYNRRVSRALGEMSGIRRHIARANEPLSKKQIEECLMAWAEEHFFTRADQRKDAHERQEILLDHFVTELGCKFRMRAVLQRGLQDFHGLTKEKEMLNAFLKYVRAVEQQAEELRKRARASNSSSEKEMPAPGSAALERAVSQKRPPTAPIPPEGTSGKKETKDPPARRIKKGGKREVLEEPAPGKKKSKGGKKKKKTKSDQPGDT